MAAQLACGQSRCRRTTGCSGARASVRFKKLDAAHSISWLGTIDVAHGCITQTVLAQKLSVSLLHYD